jgi:hypothetical protein
MKAAMAAAKRKLSSRPRNSNIPAMTPLMTCIVSSFRVDRNIKNFSIFFNPLPGLDQVILKTRSDYDR